MNIHLFIVAEQECYVGTDVRIGGESPEASFFAFFEQNEETAYFYAGDRAYKEDPIRDAVHIYDVANVADKEKPSIVKIGWSADSQKVILIIDGYPHAIFDFSSQQGYCRTAFPPPEIGSTHDWSRQSRHEWDDAMLGLFDTPL